MATYFSTLLINLLNNNQANEDQIKYIKKILTTLLIGSYQIYCDLDLKNILSFHVFTEIIGLHSSVAKNLQEFYINYLDEAVEIKLDIELIKNYLTTLVLFESNQKVNENVQNLFKVINIYN